MFEPWRRSMPRLVQLVLASAAISLGVCAPALAQDVEPNNICPFQVDAGPIVVSMDFAGSLDAASVRSGSDVDFLRFSGPPGQTLIVGVTPGTRLGLFDDDCALRASTRFDDTILEFTVPAS